jgi:hypothetical protein
MAPRDTGARCRCAVKHAPLIALGRMLEAQCTVERELFPDLVPATVVIGTAGRGLVDGYCRQFRQCRLDFIPDPAR